MDGRGRSRGVPAQQYLAIPWNTSHDMSIGTRTIIFPPTIIVRSLTVWPPLVCTDTDVAVFASETAGVRNAPRPSSNIESPIARMSISLFSGVLALVQGPWKRRLRL